MSPTNCSSKQTSAIWCGWHGLIGSHTGKREDRYGVHCKGDSSGILELAHGVPQKAPLRGPYCLRFYINDIEASAWNLCSLQITKPLISRCRNINSLLARGEDQLESVKMGF